jgi:hypothetical protein
MGAAPKNDSRCAANRNTIAGLRWRGSDNPPAPGREIRGKSKMSTLTHWDFEIEHPLGKAQQKIIGLSTRKPLYRELIKEGS